MKGSATYWSIFIVVSFLFAAVLFGLWPQGQEFEEATGLIDSKLWLQLKTKSREVRLRVEAEAGKLKDRALEQKQIDDWIAAEGLNRYGDPLETQYLGGTPLFDELTGETTNRYDYIIDKHPDRPWQEE